MTTRAKPGALSFSVREQIYDDKTTGIVFHFYLPQTKAGHPPLPLRLCLWGNIKYPHREYIFDGGGLIGDTAISPVQRAKPTWIKVLRGDEDPSVFKNRGGGSFLIQEQTHYDSILDIMFQFRFVTHNPEVSFVLRLYGNVGCGDHDLCFNSEGVIRKSMKFIDPRPRPSWLTGI